jgi:hypothetical protein
VGSDSGGSGIEEGAVGTGCGAGAGAVGSLGAATPPVLPDPVPTTPEEGVVAPGTGGTAPRP